MHTGDDDLFDTAISDTMCFIGDVVKRTACHPASHIRDNAVGTECTASVLHLNERARTFTSLAYPFAEACVFTDRVVLHRFYVEERIWRVRHLFCRR